MKKKRVIKFNKRDFIILPFLAAGATALIGIFVVGVSIEAGLDGRKKLEKWADKQRAKLPG